MDRLPPETLVVVADGEHARLFRNAGKGQAVSLRQVATFNALDLDLQGPSGVLPPQQTPQQIHEASFAKRLAQHLNAGALKDEYAHLVLVADPQTLGQLRPQLHKETLHRLQGEVAKTLTNSPLEDIEHALG